MSFGAKGATGRWLLLVAVSAASAKPVPSVMAVVFAVGLTRPFW